MKSLLGQFCLSIIKSCLMNHQCWIAGFFLKGFRRSRVSWITYLELIIRYNNAIWLWTVNHLHGFKYGYKILFEYFFKLWHLYWIIVIKFFSYQLFTFFTDLKFLNFIFLAYLFNLFNIKKLVSYLWMKRCDRFVIEWKVRLNISYLLRMIFVF